MRSVADRFDFRVCWSPFLLRHDTPPEGALKPPSTDGNPRVGVRLKQAGAAVGIDFTGKTDVRPNTVAAHALLEYVKTKNEAQQDALSEQIFQAYFTDGVAPDVKNLPEIAARVGLDRDEVNQVIHDENRLKSAFQAALAWSERGVTGVPCFYMNGQKAFSGAQEPESFIKMFEMASETFSGQ